MSERSSDPPRRGDPHVVVEHVTKEFSTHVALSDINLTIRRRQIAVIIGGSGAGKTTLLRLLIGLEKPETRTPSQLSGGMRKRVALARALMLEPAIIVYDEPTSGLDPLTSRMVDELIQETRDRFGVTSVVISHDMTSALGIADYI